MIEVQRPNTDEYAQFYQGYIERVPTDDIRLILRVQLADTLALLRPLSEQQGMFRYAPEKWSIKQVIGHLIDAERIMTYRALRIARTDDTPLPGFDEDTYAQHAGSNERTLQSLTGELEAARQSTAAFFQHLPDAAWPRRGVANNHSVTVRGLAYIIAGHELHHREILQTRYLTALSQPV
jgi:uncharacterized damage-inducible protein DinB